jgi:hypothetical protein
LHNETFMAEKIEQPSVDSQQILDMILSDEPTEFEFLGKKRKMRWLRNNTVRKFSHLTAKVSSQDKNNAQLCAALLLNDVFAWFYGICYFFYWRWLYYVRNITAVDALAVIDAAKKKLPADASFLITILATGMTDLMMTMTKKEARLSQAGQVGAQPTR